MRFAVSYLKVFEEVEDEGLGLILLDENPTMALALDGRQLVVVPGVNETNKFLSIIE